MSSDILSTHKLDIVSLISDNPITKLTKDYQTPLLTKLSDHFTTDEHLLFLSSFFCYMNYDTEKDFVIDLDKIWRWLGFSRKDHAKRMLENNFDIDVDYVIGLGSPLLGGKPPVTNLGGRPEEAIMITIDTFKLMSMFAKTTKAKEIRKYYVKLEKIIQETLEEQAEDHRKQLLVKDQEIKNKTQEVKNKTQELEIKISENERRIIDNFEKIVYAGYYGKDMKFGYTNNLERRLKDHKRTFGEQFTFEIVIPSVYNIEIEKMVKTNEILSKRIIKDDFVKTKDGKTIYGKLINGEICTEIIKLEPGKFTKEDLKTELKKFKDHAEKDLEYENEQLKSEINKLKLELELVKNADFERQKLEVSKMHAENNKKHIDLMTNQTKREPNRTEPRYQIYDPETLKLVKTYETIRDLELETELFQKAIAKTVRTHIETNVPYRGYRFWKIERDQEVKEYKIPETIFVDNSPKYEVIVKMNIDKTEIMDMFPSTKEAAQSMVEELNKTEKTIKKTITNSLTYENASAYGYNWAHMSLVNKELLKTWTKPIPEVKINKNQRKVYKFDIEKKLEMFYNSVREAHKTEQTSDLTLKKHIDNKTVFKNHYWGFDEIFAEF